MIVDEVRKRLREGLAPAAAITTAVNHLRTPLASSTMTTVFSFIPIALMPGPAGEFVGSIAIAVMAHIDVIIVALLLLPALTAP